MSIQRTTKKPGTTKDTKDTKAARDTNFTSSDPCGFNVRAPWRLQLAARGKSLAAFDGRCILDPPQRGCRVGDPGAGCVASPSNIPDILGRRALPARRLA